MANAQTLEKYLIEPPKEFRSVPFWSWNDRLDTQEINRQAVDMQAHGMGGFFMHAREGLETPYMGKEWFSRVKAAVAAAKASGTAAWIYDEDRFPSGHAAGAVTADTGDTLAAKALVMETVAGVGLADPSIVAAFTVVVEGNRLVRANRVHGTSVSRSLDGDALVVFRQQATAPSGWYGGNRAADLLDPEAVAKFIEVTHERYRDAVGEEFGRTVPGVFTDEPAIGAAIPGTAPHVPWTRGFAEYFRRKRGYDLLDLLPHLFYVGDRSTKVRHDFWRAVTERYSESFSEQVGSWCRGNHLHFTGHFLAENNLAEAVRTSGAVMPQYWHQTIPGVDILGPRTNEWSTLRQCVSVANQFGKERVLAEIYGCTGWEFTLEGQKRLIDWLLVNGVNFMCQHLALYSVRGCRKRDFPPSFNYQVPAWKHQGYVEDYTARLCAILAQGRVKRDVLLVHPATSSWALTGPSEPSMRHTDVDERVGAMGTRFNDLVRSVLSWHYDLDIADELLLSEHGFVEGSRMAVKQAQYRVAVLPPLLTILSGTAELLRRFMDNGGTVIALESLPELVDAEQSDTLVGLSRHPRMRIAHGNAGLLRALEEALPRTVSINDGAGRELPGVFCMVREIDDAYVLFVVNTDPDRGIDAHIELRAEGSLESWDMVSGARQSVTAVAGEGALRFTVAMGATDSRLFLLRQNHTPSRVTGLAAVTAREKHPSTLQRAVRFTRSAPNVLTLDRCAIRVADREWSQEMEVWQAQRLARKELGMRDVSHWGGMPRWMWVDEPHEADGTWVACRFCFDVAQVPGSPCSIGIEHAEQFTLTLNGRPVESVVNGWYLDRSIGVVALPPLSPGRNELVLRCVYRNRSELENCYLLGDFAVDPLRQVSTEPTVLQCGDWCLQGYPYFCGSMTYHFSYELRRATSADTVERKVLELGERSAASAAVTVNGAPAVLVPWACANSVDITDMLVDGVNRIDIEVFGSPRNALGPFHVARDVDWVDPGMFTVEGKGHTPEYGVKPYGLLTPVRIHHSRG